MKVKPYLPQLKARAGTGCDDDEFELEMKKLCAIIYVRMLEFYASVELYHSKYYADQRIIEAIARFLHEGTRPTADELLKMTAHGDPVLN